MEVKQGEVFWIDLEEPFSSEPGYRHPYVIIQNNLFNQGRINTIVVCALTTNLKLTRSPGNVLLNESEANLPKQSVVNISQIYTVSKSQLGDYIGTLSTTRIRQILAGIYLLMNPAEID
jgi:mRNA interferase MazF